MKHLDPNEGYIPSKVPREWYESALEEITRLESKLKEAEADTRRLDALEADWYGLIMVQNEHGWLPWKSGVDYQPTLRDAIDAVGVMGSALNDEELVR